LANLAAGRTVPFSHERLQQRHKAAELCALVCYYMNEDTEEAINSLLLDLALLQSARPNDSNESIIIRFVVLAMNGRRDDAVLEFRFVIVEETKPKNLFRRLRLRKNLQGQWKYLVDKASTALTRLPWLDYCVPWLFDDKVRNEIDWLVVANSSDTRSSHPHPDSVADPIVTYLEFKSVFVGILLNGTTLLIAEDVIDYMWEMLHPNIFRAEHVFLSDTAVVSDLSSGASPHQ
jgi:hypothetical protein